MNKHVLDGATASPEVPSLAPFDAEVAHALQVQAPERADRVMILSLVHPDMLAPVYSLSAVLAARGYAVDIFSFASPASGRPDLQGISLHICGEHRGSVFQRVLDRRRFRNLVSEWAQSHPSIAIIATCPFSYLEALRLSDGITPVVYYMLEMYDWGRRDILRSPLTALRNWRVLRRIKEAALLCTPSPERSGWLAARANLRRLPVTILNSPSRSLRQVETGSGEISQKLLPPRFRDQTLVINTGNVAPTQAIIELVESVQFWPEGVALVVTNVGSSTYAREVRHRADSSTRRSDILLLPLLERREMLALQSVASLGMCLLREGDAPETAMPAPNKIGEYIHAGLLVIGARMPYLDRLEQHGVAVLADSLTPEGIARAVTIATARVTSPGTLELVREAATSWYCMEAQSRPLLDMIDRTAAGLGSS